MSAINDAFGRHVGDLLLQCVADRLKQHFDGTDHLAHLGGGTFAALFTSEARTTSCASCTCAVGASCSSDAVPDRGATRFR